MTTFLIQNTVGSVQVYLETLAGLPATGLTYTGVVVDLKKAGASSFTNKVLSAPDFVDLGSGFYEILLSTTDTNTLGNLYVRVTGATIKGITTSAFVAASVPVNPPANISLNTVVLSGYVVKADGSPEINSVVQARVLSQPTILKPSTNALVVSTGLTTVKTDDTGFFTLSLIAGSQVDITIPAANYRRTLTVPSTGTNLFDIA